MNKGLGLLLVLFSGLLSGFAQDTLKDSIPRQTYVELLYHSGTFWSRTENLEEQFDQGYRAFEARFGFQTSGRKAWHQLHRFPKYGVGIHYADLVRTRNDTVVGNPFSLFGYYSAQWFRFGRFSIHNDWSVGLSYTPLVYHPTKNPTNDVIASHINLYFGFSLKLSMLLASRLHMDFGYGLTHHSNGKIHVPQKGVNSWGWSAGMRYDLNKPMAEYYHRELPKFKPYPSVQFMAALGTVEAVLQGSGEEFRYLTGTFTSDFVFRFSPKGAIALGLDFLYDGSLERAIKGIAPEDVITYQKMYFGTHFGYHFIIDRLTILFNLGTYYRQSSYDRGFFFGRAGGQYRITDHLHAHLAIKTRNGVRSDWIEWGAAYHLKLRQD